MPLHPLFTRLFEGAPEVSYTARSYLINAYTHPTDAFLLISGAVKIATYEKSGASVMIHVLTPGSTFPLLSLDHRKSRFWFRALNDVVVKRVPYRDFEACILSDQKLLFEQYLKMTRSVDGLAWRIEMLSTMTSRERLLWSLSYFASHFGIVQDTTTMIQIHLTHHDLASFIGCTRETVSREWEKLLREHIVHMNGDLMCIKTETLKDYSRVPW